MELTEQNVRMTAHRRFDSGEVVYRVYSYEYDPMVGAYAHMSCGEVTQSQITTHWYYRKPLDKGWTVVGNDANEAAYALLAALR